MGIARRGGGNCVGAAMIMGGGIVGEGRKGCAFALSCTGGEGFGDDSPMLSASWSMAAVILGDGSKRLINRKGRLQG